MPDLDPKQAHVVSTWQHDAPLNACRFDKKGKFLFCGSEDNLVERYSLVDGQKTLFQGGHDTWVRGLETTPDGKLALSGGCDGRLSWWEVSGDGKKPLRTVDAHQGWIRSVDISPDGQLVATGGNDNRARIWKVADGQRIAEITGHQKHVYNVRFHPDGKSLWSGDLTGKIIRSDVANAKEISTLDGKDLHTYHKGQQTDFGGVRGIAVNTQKKLLAAAGTYKGSNPFGAIHEPLVVLFNYETGKLEKKLIADGIKRGVLWRVVWLNEEILCGVCGGGDGGFLIFWKPDSEKDYFRFKLPYLARDLDVHPDGIQIATAHYDKKVRITRLAPKQKKT